MHLTIALAQLNPTVGDIDGNLARIRRARDRAAAGGADLVVLPELALIGYPPEDLVLRPSVVDACHAAIDCLVRESHNAPALIATTPWREDGRVYNAAIVIDKGTTTRRFKSDLPNYGVFDEKRVFTPGPMPDPVNFRGITIGVPVCEDIWTPASHDAPGARGRGVLHRAERLAVRDREISRRASSWRVHARAKRIARSIYVNQIGGQDELVFDGRSFVLNRSGELACSLAGWDEAIELTRWTRTHDGWTCEPGRVETPGDQLADTYSALIIGLRDYVDKNGFPGIVLGLSGGVDSALSAAVGVDALGPERVLGVRLPSPFTGQVSMEEAQLVADRLGIRLLTLPIEQVMTSAEAALAPVFEGRPRDVAEENLQARIRGLLLMALSNKFGSMLLTTGNKSEMSVGYATLYGDMCGGFSVLKDIYKTEVYRLSRWRNAQPAAAREGPARRGDSRAHAHATSDRRASAEPDRPGLASALRPARCDSDGARRRGEVGRRDCGRRRAARDRHARAADALHRRIQAPPGAAGRQGEPPQLRARSPLSDYQSVS